jgi:uncharacterized lipoprotein YmbA
MNHSFLRIAALAALSLAAGCANKGERYYRLSATGPVPENAKSISLGVGPVKLPDYIDRAELVFQSSPNRFEAPYEHRWAGSLRDGFAQVLGIDLARELGVGNLHIYPWEPGTALRYQVRVEVRQFHAESGGHALLDVSWEITDGSTRAVLVHRTGHFSEPVRGDGYEAIVAAESRLLSQLSRAIAKSFPRNRA